MDLAPARFRARACVDSALQRAVWSRCTGDRAQRESMPGRKHQVDASHMSGWRKRAVWPQLRLQGSAKPRISLGSAHTPSGIRKRLETRQDLSLELLSETTRVVILKVQML